MPLFEVETTSHIMIACVDDDAAARSFATEHYPSEEIIRVSHRPRDAWVISKKLLGIGGNGDVCSTARDCLAKRRGTSCTRCGSTCRRRGRTWTVRARRSRRIWSGAGESVESAGPTISCESMRCAPPSVEHFGARYDGAIRRVSPVSIGRRVSAGTDLMEADSPS